MPNSYDYPENCTTPDQKKRFRTLQRKLKEKEGVDYSPPPPPKTINNLTINGRHRDLLYNYPDKLKTKEARKRFRSKTRGQVATQEVDQTYLEAICIRCGELLTDAPHQIVYVPTAHENWSVHVFCRRPTDRPIPEEGK
jgi:hypothetical protein